MLCQGFFASRLSNSLGSLSAERGFHSLLLGRKGFQANDAQQMQPLRQQITSDHLAMCGECFSPGSHELWFQQGWQCPTDTGDPVAGQALGLQTLAQPDHVGLTSQVSSMLSVGQGPALVYELHQDLCPASDHNDQSCSHRP